MAVKPRVKVAIQYDPEGRGVRLALAYCRIRRRSEPFFDLYGTCVGYCAAARMATSTFMLGSRLESVSLPSRPPLAVAGTRIVSE